MSLRDTAARANDQAESLRADFQRINKLFKEPAEQEVVQDIHESLKQHEEAVELLQQDVEGYTSTYRSQRTETDWSREVSRLSAQVVRLGEDIKHARGQFRRAQLSVKRASEASARTEREARFAALKAAYSTSSGDKTSSDGTAADLFAGRRKQNKQLTEDELLINTSSDITAALRATHDKLTSEIGRSRFAQETLAQSTAALSDLGERYSDLDTLLANSKTLLSTLVKSQKSDTWYLETAFYILVVTLVWLVFRRFIYGPAWWFVWLPLKYFLFQPLAFLIRAFGASPDGVEGLRHERAASSAALRVQPSAIKGERPIIPEGVRIGGQPVGAGGSGARSGPQGQYREESLVDKIGRMAAEGRGQDGAEGQSKQPGQDSRGDTAQEVKRGDGTVLEQRGDRPANPKKRMMEVDLEDAEHGRQDQHQQAENRQRQEL